MPRVLADAGFDVIGVGKIHDIFAGDGITETHPITSNDDGMEQTLALAEKDFRGLCFVNLVDFDSRYGHRRDRDGYAAALTAFDGALGRLLPRLRTDDLLLISADHGCDPGFTGTDHTREYVPLLAAGATVRAGTNLGTRVFSDLGATVLDIFGVAGNISGRSFAAEILRGQQDSL